MVLLLSGIDSTIDANSDPAQEETHTVYYNLKPLNPEPHHIQTVEEFGSSGASRVSGALVG